MKHGMRWVQNGRKNIRIARLFAARSFRNRRMGMIYPTHGRGDWLLILGNPPWGDKERRA